MTPDLLTGIHRNPRRESALRRMEMTEGAKTRDVGRLDIPVHFAVAPEEIQRIEGVVRDAVERGAGGVDITAKVKFNFGIPEVMGEPVA